MSTTPIQTKPGYTIEARIYSALERARQRGHYAHLCGYSDHFRAFVFYVKSSEPARSGVSGYTVYVYSDPSHGGYRYEHSLRLWARCECRSAQYGRPCDHGAKAVRAAGRRVRVMVSAHVVASEAHSCEELASYVCPNCGHENEPGAVFCEVCRRFPDEAARERALEDYEVYQLVS